MLFSKPLHEINFSDVDDFCRAWPEGVRVEYKRELVPRHIPKVVSSFANTGGGVWILGVTTGVDNLPVFPIRGFPREAGLEERITQTCYQNLYPPLFPEIKIIDVPGDPAKVIAVVQVPESVEAPHAVENTTKVYIRTNSTTEHIDLAEIDRVEYLLKRRREAELKRDDMLKQLATYSGLHNNAVRVRIGPQYPYRPLLTRDLLTQRVKSIPGVRISPFVHPIREGYMAPSPYPANTFQDEVYFATNFHGMIVYEERLEKSQHPREPGTDIIHLENVIACINQGLTIAKILLNEITANLKLEVLVEGIAKSTVYIQGPHHSETGGYAVDNTSSAEASLRSEQLNDSDFMTQVLVDLIYQLMWPFNWHNRDEIKLRIDHNFPPKKKP